MVQFSDTPQKSQARAWADKHIRKGVDAQGNERDEFDASPVEAGARCITLEVGIDHCFVFPDRSKISVGYGNFGTSHPVQRVSIFDPIPL